MADLVVTTVRSSSGRTSRSNCARLSIRSRSSSGTKITVLDDRDSISLAVRASSQSWRRARMSCGVLGCSSLAQTDCTDDSPSAAGSPAGSSAMAPRKPMIAASMSRPPMSARPSLTRTSKPPAARAITLTSNVPAPRSYTTRLPGGRL
jgi:hypothetical protein